MNNLLTKLDDQVETVVEERTFAKHDLSSENVNAARSGIDDILVKRGLSSMDSKDETYEKEKEPLVEKNMVQEDDDNEDDKQYVQDENKSEEAKSMNRAAIEYANVVDTKKTESFDNNLSSTTAEKETERPEVDKLIENSSVVEGQHLSVQQNSEATSLKDHGEDDHEVKKKDENSEVVSLQKVEKSDEKRELNTIKQQIIASPKLSALSKSKDKSSPSSLTPPPIVGAGQMGAVSSINQEQEHRAYTAHSPDRSRKEIRGLVLERKEAQKEARTLRRHIVALNDQLEIAESELQAQRRELERAAERMEKDRSQHKKEKEASQKRNTEEIKQLKTQYEKSMNDQQARFEEQLERYRRKLSDEEKRRKQQGGNWDKEMSNAIDRENNMRQELNSLEEEKSVLLSQISTLQGQQTALGSRLESLSEAADNAIQRERDAENRLDDVLNQHARQIGHRQARESQLERTIQDLNAALVVSRSKARPPGNNNSACDGVTDHSVRGNSHLEARIDALELNLQTANSHLAIEKERSDTLQIQLRSFSNETTHEASIVHAKEIQYDRRIADMSITISELEEKLRQYEKLPPNNLPASIDSLNDQKIPHEIKLLSEEVVRLRDKIANHSSESLAMKSRLKAAVDRSNKLEDELQIAKMSSNSDEPLYDSKEQGRHTASSGRRRNFGAMHNSSIRTAMMLNSTRGERTEQIGEVVDQIDSFASSTGKYLRRNPVARAGFIFYLILMHLWTFVLLFFHVHSFDTALEGDFNAGVGYSHGPHAMMQQQKIIKNLELHEATGK